MPYRQDTPTPPRKRVVSQTSNQPTAATSATNAATPITKAMAVRRSCSTQKIRNAMAITAGPKARITSGGGGPRSRRRTRSAGVRDNCNSGGSANPLSTAMAVRKPMPSGANPGAGRSPRSSPSRAFTSQACAPKPSNEPNMAASRPTMVSCTRLTTRVKPRVAPKVLSSATESRCR